MANLLNELPSDLRRPDPEKQFKPGDLVRTNASTIDDVDMRFTIDKGASGLILTEPYWSRLCEGYLCKVLIQDRVIMFNTRFLEAFLSKEHHD